MILIGASGHAKVILDIIIKSGVKLDFLVDANPEIKSFMGYEVRWQNEFVYENQETLIAVGANAVRKKLAEHLKAKFASVVHPKAILAEDVSLGEGSVVMAGAVVNSSCQIGRHAIINTACSIDHDCKLGDYTHVSPGATLCGSILIGEGTHIGAGVTILPNIIVGKWAIIGAGTVITKDVPDNAVLVGNPGKIVRYNE